MLKTNLKNKTVPVSTSTPAFDLCHKCNFNYMFIKKSDSTLSELPEHPEEIRIDINFIPDETNNLTASVLVNNKPMFKASNMSLFKVNTMCKNFIFAHYDYVRVKE